MDYRNQVLLGDCLTLLRQLPSDTFDICITDPPYGLGKKAPRPEEILAFFMGASLDTGGDFMNSDWEIPTVEVWKEIYRVLKPGAHVISFGGTRTWDLISIGLRLAGFTYRDTIADEHPALQWLQSQGMPKSHNVSKAYDRKKGIDVKAEDYKGPVTEAAVEWSGYGTGLKPTWEPILVFRKPFKGTVAKNVQKHGTGALNIDACRVKHASREDFEQHKAQVEEVRKKGGVRGDSWKNSSDLSGASEVTEAGRWPPNTIFEHTPGCRKVGVKEVAPHPQGSDRFQKTSGGDFSSDYQNQRAQEDPDYLYEWECAPGCPAAALNKQTGDRPSTLTGRADPSKSHAHPGTQTNPNSTFLGERTYHSAVYADSGGASRYYPQFEQELEEPFLYVGKASKREASLNGRVKKVHKTRKPVKLMRWLCRLSGRKGALVLDPYCGSGSTLVAADLEDMFWTGIERDPEMQAAAEQRVSIVHEEEQRRREQRETFAMFFERDDND